MVEVHDYLSVLGRILSFVKKHKVRVIAGLLLVIGGVLIGIAPTMSRAIWLVSLSPLLAGACVPLLALGQATNWVNGWQEVFSSGIEKARNSDTKEARYVLRPLHGSGLGIWRLSKRVPGDHLKAGIRLAAVLYLGMVVLSLLAAVLAAWLFAVAVTLVIMAALWIFGSKEEEMPTAQTSAPSSDFDGYAPVRGLFYRGSSWFTEEMAGRVDDEGNIYRGRSWITEERIGRVDSDGTIYKGTSMLNGEIVGRIDRDGTVYKGSNWFTEERAGRVADDGTVYEGKSWLDEKRIGRVDKE